jgi:hypothetical protein
MMLPNLSMTKFLCSVMVSDICESLWELFHDFQSVCTWWSIVQQNRMAIDSNTCWPCCLHTSAFTWLHSGWGISLISFSSSMHPHNFTILWSFYDYCSTHVSCYCSMCFPALEWVMEFSWIQILIGSTLFVTVACLVLNHKRKFTKYVWPQFLLYHFQFATTTTPQNLYTATLFVEITAATGSSHRASPI